ncbi:hypothetical protein [Paludibaculum fermentans]|uniref:hypothetical protein n=1 Tax=Paludibaculum fermentans TaxID=1473598 RepID=UPI003EB8EC36
MGVIPSVLLDEEETIKINSFTWVGSSLRIRLTLLSDKSRWIITCAGASSWRIQDRVTDGFSVSEDDPVLWLTQFATYMTYFAGKPSNPHRAVCDLLSVTPRTSEVFRFRPDFLADLLSTGCGSLGLLPVPAIRLLAPILKSHGVELYHLGPDESETTDVSFALLFGHDSFVIAKQFDAAKQG